MPPLANRALSLLAYTGFALALAFSLWTASVGWNHSIVDEHSFRQTQTAIVAYYMRAGGPFFAYEMPVLGPPWSVPFELPVYQWLVAKFSLLSGMHLEQAGRFIGRGFFYLALLPLFGIARAFGMNRAASFALLAVYLVNPLLLFWSRTFLIESTAVTLSLAYFAAFVIAVQSRRPSWLLATALLGILAAPTKVTTFFAFGLAAGAFFLYDNWRAGLPRNAREWKERAVLPALAGFFLPAIALLAWTGYSDALKGLNPLAEFITSQKLKTWNFGTLAQRLDGSFWYMLFRKEIHGGLGHRTTWILSMLAIWLVPARWRVFYFASLLLFLIPPLTFTNLHIEHEYYAVSNAVFLVIAFGFCLGGLFSAEANWKRYAGAVLFVTAVVLGARTFLVQPYNRQKVDFPSFADYGKQVREIVGPEEVLLIYGFDWHPMIPYYSERRAIMDRDPRPLDSEEMHKSFAGLGERKLGAVILCNPLRTDAKFLAEVRKHLGIGAEPTLRHMCDLYKLP